VPTGLQGRYTELAALAASLQPAPGGVATARSTRSLPLAAAGLQLHIVPYLSRHAHLLLGHASYSCTTHGVEFPAVPTPRRDWRAAGYPSSLCIEDAAVVENQEFTYLLFTPAAPARARGVIILLHGLNERTWDKYLPWAMSLALRTGKAVMLFPIAFHMDRAALEWSAPRAMRRVSLLRREHSPTIANSSLANAAISTRLESLPQRFFWTGLQTFEDLLDVVAEIRRGDMPDLAPDATVDFFAYSIGAFLAEILLMANPGGVLRDARLCVFCGGPTLDRMYPNSRYILDSDATIALASFFVERLDSEVRADARLAHYFGAGHAAGRCFQTMLSSHKHQAEREQALRGLGKRLIAIALRDDEVVPPSEVLNTLQGGYRDIPIPVEILHFPFRYSHMVPFPTAGAPAPDVDAAFESVFARAAAHFMAPA
jgi:hypothetical protein